MLPSNRRTRALQRCLGISTARPGDGGMGSGLATRVGQATSRRVEHGEGDESPQGRHTVPQRFDGAGTREVEEDTVFGLFDLRRDFAEGQEHGRGLGGGQRGLWERVGAQGRMQDIRGTRQEEPHGVRQEGRGGRAVAVEVTRDGLERVVTMPTRAVKLLRHPRRRGGPQGGDDKGRGVASDHHLGLENAPPWLGPGRRGLGERVREPAAGGRARALGLREGRALLVQAACRLHDGCGVAKEDGMAGQAEDAIDAVPMGQDCEHLRGRDMTVAAHQDRGPWPVATQEGEESDADHGMLRAEGPCARAEAGRHQRPCKPLEDHKRPGAIMRIIMVGERQLLLPGGRIVRVIEIEPNGGRRLRVARDEVGSQRLRQPREVFPVHTVCKPREGRGTRESLLWSQRGAFHAQLKQGITSAAVGIIAVRRAGGNVRETLGQEVTQGVSDVGRMAGIVDGGRKACSQANLAVDAAE